MPIETLQTDGSFTKACCKCGARTTIAPADIELGLSMSDAHGTHTDPNIIVLPQCGCGAQEYLSMVFDEIPAHAVGSPFDQRRRAVNALGEKLKALGRKNADCAAAIDARSAPTDLDPLTSALTPTLPSGVPADPNA